MKYKIKRLLFLLKNNMCDTLVLKIKKITKGKFILYNNTAVKYQPSSRIIINKGVFEINKKWTSNDPFPSIFAMGENSKVIVHDSFAIYSGSRIYVNNNATLLLGSGYINNNLNLSCFSRIEIGHNVVISENVSIRDSDNHNILNATHEKTKPIIIGNQVWIGMNVTILKGITIGDGAIIAAGTVVNKDVPPNCLAGGIPVKVLKTNVEWE